MNISKLTEENSAQNAVIESLKLDANVHSDTGSQLDQALKKITELEGIIKKQIASVEFAKEIEKELELKKTEVVELKFEKSSFDQKL